MKEYKISKGLAIFIYIIGSLFIALFTLILFLPVIPGMENEVIPDVYWFLAVISLAMISLITIGLIDIYKGKFVIDKNKIFSIGVFSKKELLFNEIKGYRTSDKFIFIESKNEHKKKIKVTTYFEKTDEIKTWLSNNFSDLDIVQIVNERKEILNNPEFGATSKEREIKLTQAFKTAKIINWSGGIIAAWTLLFPNPYEYAIIASIIFPLVCLVILKYHHGLIRTDERKDSAYPSIFWAIFILSTGLSVRALLDYKIFDYSNVWIPSVLILLTYLGILGIGNKEFNRNDNKVNFSIIAIALFIYGYSYSTVVTLNCIYDKSEPKIYDATVLDKHVTAGKTKTYYVKLTPWGSLKEIEDVSVSQDLYNRLQYHDKVKIYFMNGRFEIPWFKIVEQ